MDDRWLSVEAIAEYIGVSKDAASSWGSGKGMPCHRVGRFWKFKRDEVDAWVRAGGASTSDGPPRTPGDRSQTHSIDEDR